MKRIALKESANYQGIDAGSTYYSSWIAASKNWNPTRRKLSGVFFILFCEYRKPRVYPWMNAFGDGTMDKCNITPRPIVSITRSITQFG